MSKVNGNSLMFDEDDVRETHELMPRLVRIVFYGLGITNNSYLDRYHRYFRETRPDTTRKEFSQKAAADRKFLLDRRKITFNMMRSVMSAMGYDVECVSMRLRDQLTGEVKTYSTDDTVDDLKASIESAREIGIQSL